jgi:hypothetical protein
MSGIEDSGLGFGLLSEGDLEKVNVAGTDYDNFSATATIDDLPGILEQFVGFLDRAPRGLIWRSPPEVRSEKRFDHMDTIFVIKARWVKGERK